MRLLFILFTFTLFNYQHGHSQIQGQSSSIELIAHFKEIIQLNIINNDLGNVSPSVYFIVEDLAGYKYGVLGHQPIDFSVAASVNFEVDFSLEFPSFIQQNGMYNLHADNFGLSIEAIGNHLATERGELLLPKQMVLMGAPISLVRPGYFNNSGDEMDNLFRLRFELGTAEVLFQQAQLFGEHMGTLLEQSIPPGVYMNIAIISAFPSFKSPQYQYIGS